LSAGQAGLSVLADLPTPGNKKSNNSISDVRVAHSDISLYLHVKPKVPR
jgi:hypothetical protein